ncbi:hypothetical protein PCA31118_04500 [Pandoraea captiosa]|uniref:Uncharacterized protein n=1 Tax=Pandoraea captiosa TaxID=2508302 RepID=A0A5E5ALB7_9BURK|nr:hypothetical protein [Pandoraea captiosa]VVE73323.1 hypothetical protein PCA31118_04500 [Pandoraea captiosa]
MRGLHSAQSQDKPSSSPDVSPDSPSRRRFLWQSAALGAAPALAHASPAADAEFSARRTANGFAFLHRGQVVWAVDVRWLAHPSSCLLSSGPEHAQVSLPRAAMPGALVPCTLSARLSRVDGRLRLSVEHALGNGAVDLDSWLNGHADLSLGPIAMPFDIHTAMVSIAPDRPVMGFLTPDLGLRLHADAAFTVHDRELSGVFDECLVAPAIDMQTRLVPNAAPRVAHLTLRSVTSGGARVHPRPKDTQLQCAAFTASQLRFEYSEHTHGAAILAWLASADAPVTLHSASLGWVDSPRVSLLAQSLSFGRVISDEPASLLVAATSNATLHANDLVLHGACVDCEPLVMREGGARSRPSRSSQSPLSRSVVWQRGVLRDNDGVSVQLHFREGATPPDPDAITELLDSIPLPGKRISLRGVEIEFTRPEDGLWLRASLDGYSLARQFGRYVVTLDGTRSVGDNVKPPMLHLRLPPQSFSEQAFYRAPPTADRNAKWPPAGANMRLGADRNEIARQGITQADRIDAAITMRDRPDGSDESIPQAARSALRVAGDTVLRFTPRAGRHDSFELSLSALLDPRRWQFRIAPQARRTSDAAGQASLDDVTDIELPWRVHLSPDENALLSASPQRLRDTNTFNPLFYLRPHAPQGMPRLNGPSADLPLRAIASPDHGRTWMHFGSTTAPTGTRPPVDPVRTALDEQDRNELVWLTSRWRESAIAGTANVENGVYIPQPIRAQRLLLSALGGSMRSTGRWDPPALKLDVPPSGNPVVAMSIEAWDHASTLGRAHHDRVVYRGYLMPFGFRVALIKMTTREVEFVPGRGYLAIPVQRYFIHPEDPVKVFPCAVGQPLESLNGFFQPERFEMLLDGDLQIYNPAAKDILGFGQDAFWVCAPPSDRQAPFPFRLRIGNSGHGNVPMAFVSNRVIHDPAQMRQVADEFNRNGVLLTTDAAKITFAPSVRQGDTRFTTHAATINAVVNDTVINSALLESQHQPPFYPVLVTADVELDAIQRTSGQKNPQRSRVRYAQLYRNVGFTQPKPAGATTAQGNPAEVFLTLTTPASMSFTGAGERGGGVATPNMTANALSRSKGLISGFVDLASPQGQKPSAPVLRALRRIEAGENPAVASTRTTTSTSVEVGGFDNPFATDAKLLGLIPLREVFKVVGLSDLPAFVESIDEAIAEQTGDVAAKLSAFGAQVRDAAISMIRQLDDQTSFVATDEGKQLRADLVSMQTAAALLAQSQSDLPERLQKTVTLTTRIRQLDAALRAIAAHPESLLNLNAIQEIRTTYVTPLVDAVTQARAQVGQALDQACKEANAQIDALVQQLQNEVSDAYSAVCDRFAQQVLEYAATHRQGLIALANSVRDADDVLTQLRWLAQCYDDYYQRGFGIPDVVQQFKDSAPVRDVTDALNQVRASVQTLATTHTTEWRKLCQTAVGMGLAVEDAWNKKKRDYPAQAKACAAPFTVLSRHLHDLVLAGHAGEVTDDMLLAPFNRAHQILLEVLASLDRAPDDLNLLEDETVTKALAALDAASHAMRKAIVGVEAAVRHLHQVLKQNSWRALASSVLTQYVDQTVATLSVAANAGSDTLHVALALCEAIGSLVDLRLDGTPAAAPTVAGQGYSPPVEKVRQSIVAIDATLRRIAQTAWRGIDAILKPLSALKAPPAELTPLIGAKLIDRTNDVRTRAAQCSADYAKAAGAPNGLTAQDVLALNQKLGGLADAINDWIRLIHGLPVQIEARALDMLRDAVQTLLASVVPARISADLNVKRQIEGYDNIFVASHRDIRSCLELKAHVETDLIARKTNSTITGSLTNFEIKLLEMVTLGITRLAFSADNGKMHLESPQIDGVTIGKPLDFLEGLEAWMNGSNGPFVLPMPSGVRAGYRMSGANIPLGPILVINYSFEAAVELPFDDRAAIFSVAVGSKANPCLVSVPPYGGGMFFAMHMAGTRLVSLEAAIEYGLVGGFKRGVVEGMGRVVIGLYITKNADGGLLEGYFYAGGHATIAHFISISVDLRIQVRYSSKGRVDGSGRFSVSIGAGPFSWTFRYSVEYHANTKAAGVLATTSGCEHRDAPPTPPGTPDDLQPVNLLDGNLWAQYRDAFALGDTRARANTES